MIFNVPRLHLVLLCTAFLLTELGAPAAAERIHRIDLTAAASPPAEDSDNRSYELISVLAVLTLFLVLVAALMHGWFSAGRQGDSVLLPTTMDVSTSSSIFESSTSSAHARAVEVVWDEAAVKKLNPMETLTLLSRAMTDFYRLNSKDTAVPRDFVIPRADPWPKVLWNFPLGRVFRKLPGSNNGVSVSSVDLSSLTPSSRVAAHQEVGNAQSGHHDEFAGESWYELFYDLIFVAAALQLGLILKYDHRVIGLLRAGGLFLILKSTYDQLTLYQSKFHRGDLTHISYYAIQAMGAFVIAINIQVEQDKDEHKYYWDRSQHQTPIAMACVLLRIVTVFMYMRQQAIGRGDSEYLKRIVTHTSVSAGIFALSTFCSTEQGNYLFLIVWIVAILVERPIFLLVHVMNGNEFPVAFNPAQVGHFISRQAIFFMLILGEAVIQLVQASTTFSLGLLSRELLGFMVVFNVGSVYHEQQMREPDRHVLSRSPLYSVLWVEMQSLFSMSVLFYCVGVKLVFHEFDEDKILRDEVIMCGFASLSLLLIYSMNVMHDGIFANFFTSTAPLGHNLFRFVMSLAISFIPFFVESTTMTVIFLFVTTSFLVIHDILIRTTRLQRLSDMLSEKGKNPNVLSWKNAMDSTHHFTRS